MVGGGRFELPRLAAQGPKPCMSAISSPAHYLQQYRKTPKTQTQTAPIAIGAVFIVRNSRDDIFACPEELA